MHAVEDTVATRVSPRATLTAAEVRRLTLYKWKYSLESDGFTAYQAEQLLFMKWLVARGRLGGQS